MECDACNKFAGTKINREFKNSKYVRFKWPDIPVDNVAW